MTPGAVIRRHPWGTAVAAAAVAIALLHLLDLGGAPPGLYSDEASIGYNAWAVAHHGVDEHGVRFPLFFEAFGEWKNPLYIYMLAPLTWVLPLTPTVERLPAALCSLGVVAAVGASSWHLSRSRAVLLASVLTAGVTPWLAVEGRVGFEVPSMTLVLALAVYCLVRLFDGGGVRWGLGAGVMVGASLYAYSTGRLLAGLLLVLLLAVLLVQRRPRAALAVLLPVVVAYVVLLSWSQGHPGALTARFDALSITADHPSLPVIVQRFVRNYVTYFGAPFLATHGDANVRQNTEFGGMLLICTIPAVLLGVVACLRDLRSPLHQFLLGGLAVAPVAAALTAEGTPHALRSCAMLPFLLVLAALGWTRLVPVLLDRRLRLVASVLVAAAATEVVAFEHDLFVNWPGEALGAFDSGEADAISRAHAIAGGRTLHLSGSLDQPYIQTLFVLRPDPRDYVRRGLASAGATLTDAGSMGGVPAGDLLVLAPDDQPPDGAVQLFSVTATVSSPVVTVVGPQTSSVLLVSVYRR